MKIHNVKNMQSSTFLLVLQHSKGNMTDIQGQNLRTTTTTTTIIITKERSLPPAGAHT